MNAVRVVVATLMLLSLAACAAGPSVDGLRHEPMYQLTEPTSTDIGITPRERERSFQMDGPGNAYIERFYGSPTPMGEIVAFYDRELSRDGWEPGVINGIYGRCSRWPDLGWQKGDLNISLGFFDELPASATDRLDLLCLHHLPKDSFEQHATLYEVVFSYNPSPYRPGSASPDGS